MADIHVEPIQPGDRRGFRVRVTDTTSTSEHTVTLAAEDAQRLAPDHDAQDLVEASFRFLLDHEPKEAILRSFDIRVIGDYFPNFENRVREYL